MKRLKYILLLLILINSVRLSADIIIVEPKPARICIRVKNLDDFPNIAVIGLNNCLAFSKSNKAYVVKSNSYLKIHKSCPLTLYAIKKGYLKMNDLEKIDWVKDKNVIKSNLTINSKTFKTFDAIDTVEIDFKIAGFSDTCLVLYKSKQIFKYSNGRPDSIQYLNYKGDISKLHPDFK